ncbi:MAG: YggT family protein [Candidatus Gastranaerophilales bacterium]|jgi:YggT family protein|nr:YggT family protein [Candidatus Gastranaerophilales bacterium]
MLKESLAQLFQIVYIILILRILLTWFPNIDWWKQPYKFMHDFSEPFFAPFRRLIPPIGGLDLSPIFAFIALQFIFDLILRIVP